MVFGCCKLCRERLHGAEESEITVGDSDTESSGDGSWSPENRAIHPVVLAENNSPQYHDPWGSQEWDSLFIPAHNFPRAPGTGVFASASLASARPDAGPLTSMRHTREQEVHPTMSMWNAGQQQMDSLFMPPGMFPAQSGLVDPATASNSSAALTSSLASSRMMGSSETLISGLNSSMVGPLIPASLTEQDLMSKSLALSATGLPAAQAPGETPFFTELFPNATVNQVRKAMRAKPFFLERLFRESQKARDMKTSAWQEGNSVPGTFVRGLRFVMNLPNDLPAAVARMVKVPESSRVTVVVRLKESPEEVVMLYQTCTHDAPYGENFRVQDTLCFSPDLAGQGVRLSRWVEVAWVKDLPWGLGMIKGAVESSVKNKSTESQPAIVKLLKEVIQGRT